MRLQNSHSRTKTVVRAALVATLAVGLMAGSVFAGGKPAGGGGKGKPSAGGGGTISLVMVADANGNGSANWNDSITYDVSRATVSNPFITTTCSVNGTVVMSQWAGFYEGYMWPAARVVTLSNENWTSGAGDCIAELYGTSTKISFHVGS